VGLGFQTLIEDQPVEDIQAARDVIFNYSNRLKAQDVDIDGSFQSWINKVRQLAGLTLWSEQNGITYRTDTEGVTSSADFWRDIYLEVVDKSQAVQALRTYILGPNTENKDSSYLLETIERMQEEGVASTLHIESSHLKSNRLIRDAYDNFSRMLGEAADSGWTNAAAIQRMQEKIPKRGFPLHAVTNNLGNQVTRILNRQAAQEGGAQLDYLNELDITHMPEAIARCLHLVFNFGQTPEGHDSLNYELTGQILGIMCREADRLIRGQQ
jgi:hypothetical protein